MGVCASRGTKSLYVYSEIQFTLKSQANPQGLHPNFKYLLLPIQNKPVQPWGFVPVEEQNPYTFIQKFN